MKNYSEIMLECAKYYSELYELDTKYEQYVRSKVKSLVDIKDYFEARNLVSKYYRKSRMNDNGEFDVEFDPALLGYTNIIVDISFLNKDLKVKYGDFINIDVDVESIENIYNKSIEYHSIIRKTGNELNEYFKPILLSLLNDNKKEEAIIKLDKFFKDSFVKNGGKIFSCFIEYDLFRSIINRY